MAYQLFLESFDTETFSTNASGTTFTRWIVTGSMVGSSSVSTSTGNGRHGSNSLRLAAESNSSPGVRTRTLSTSTYFVLGFSYISRSGTGRCEFVFLKGSTTIVTVNLTQSGFISVTLGGTTYVSTNSLTTGGYIEIGLVIGNSGSLEVRVNGTSDGWLNLSGVDTQPGADTTADTVRLTAVGSSATTVDIDDLYITYGDELKWLGDIRVDAFALDGNVMPNDWTPDTGNAWERLNQAAGNVKSNIINAESLFSVANISFDTPEVHGVQIGVVANKTDVEQRNMVIEANNNNITVNSSVIALGTSNTEYLYSMTKDTDGANWTKQRFNDLKVGIKVVE